MSVEPIPDKPGWVQGDVDDFLDYIDPQEYLETVSVHTGEVSDLELQEYAVDELAECDDIEPDEVFAAKLRRYSENTENERFSFQSERLGIQIEGIRHLTKISTNDNIVSQNLDRTITAMLLQVERISSTDLL